MSKYSTVIGLEIHLQLKTKSKMFCSCSNDGENQPPNTTVCPICLGHPGVLPTLNEQAVKYGLLMALALDCQINKKSKFDRKNYFYPDLSKGYQISQFDEPLATGGHLVIEVEGRPWSIGLERLHLEEDAAKNIHVGDKTLVDFNRGGTPLIEIVTKPDFKHPAEAKEFLQELRLLARYLGVSSADMEKGHLRCDANISLRPQGDSKFYPKTEIKNLNSFKAVAKALLFEEKRQHQLWEKGQAPEETSTRGWDENKEETVAQRSKEGSADYRYFPEPDLPPLVISEEWLAEAKSQMPELPMARKNRFAEEYGLSSAEARVLVNQKIWADYYEEIMSDLRSWLFNNEKMAEDSSEAEELWQKHKIKLSRLSFAWLTTNLFGLLGTNFNIKDLKISPENMSELLKLIYEKKISSSAGQTILVEMFKTGGDPSDILDKSNLSQIDDQETLDGLVVKVIMTNPKQVEDYRKGKIALLKFFVGQVMKESGGKANPQVVEEILKKKLK
jgi:aspartyl-tRNA(Asn)/glutamyl-tRNA(Gln) amidotransferase subunit B